MTFTYDTLVSAVLSNVEDASDELITYLPTAIDLAETRLSQQLDGSGQKKVQNVVLTTADPFVSKPPEILAPRFFCIYVSGRAVFLDYRTDEFVMDYWPDETSMGTPKFYADYGEYKYLVAPAPSSAYRGRMSFIHKVCALTSTNSTNWFTRKAPNALFFATMVEVADWMKNPEMRAEWDVRCSGAVDLVNNQGRRERRDDREVPRGEPENNLRDGAV